MNSDRPKILFVMHVPPPVHGAAMVGKYIHDSELVNSMFECRYINPTTAKNLEDIQQISFSKVKRIFELIYKIQNEIRLFAPDVVYFTANSAGKPFYKDYLLMHAIKRAVNFFCPNSKIVVHYHNKGVSKYSNRIVDNQLYKAFFKGIKIILLSKLLYKDVEKYVNVKDVYVCPNGIPNSINYEPLAKRDNQIPCLLFLSNLLIEKGAIDLLDALKILKKRGFRFTCCYVGGETDDFTGSQFLEEIEKRGLTDCVSYEGRKYGRDKAAYFSNADIFIFPTRNEAFGLVSLEAMEYKLPVVSTNEGGVPDVVRHGENGIIVSVGANGVDPEELAHALSVLLENPTLRMAMGEDGYRKFKKHFTLVQFEKRFVDIMKSICQS